ncbi:leptin [Ctenodactylus gundi]
MHCGPLRLLLWLWPYLLLIQAKPIDKVQDDTKNLIETIVTRINDITRMRSLSSSQDASGLNFIPDLYPVLSLSKMDRILAIYQQLLNNLNSQSLVQLSNDLMNLRELAHTLASSKNCPLPVTNDLASLDDYQGISRDTSEATVLSELQGTMKDMLEQMDFSPVC